MVLNKNNTLIFLCLPLPPACRQRQGRYADEGQEPKVKMIIEGLVLKETSLPYGL